MNHLKRMLAMIVSLGLVCGAMPPQAEALTESDLNALVPSVGRALDGFAGDQGPQDFGAAHVFGGNGEDIAIEKNEVGAFAGGDGADLLE